MNSLNSFSRIRMKLLNLISLPWFRWQPNWDIVVALVTMLYMIPSYYYMANNLHPYAIYNFFFASTFVLVLLPAYYVLKVRREPLDQLGITKQHWVLSLSISLVFLLRLIPRMLGFLSNVPTDLVLPTIIFNGLCLWEPFFVYCWVQLRFERAFGVIPGILAAGLCLGSYHLGTYPLRMVFMLGIVGLIYGVVFRLTRSLLILWPLTWTVASTIGTVSGGFTFGWQTVFVYAVIILLQGTGIWWIARTRSNRKDTEDDYIMSDLEANKIDTNWRDWVLSCIYGLILVFQMAFTYFNYNTMGFDIMVNTGWAIMMVSAIFGWLPIYTFRKKGGVTKGDSYMHTTILVDSGIYSIVRHPQYFAGILISLSMVLISQHWLNVFLLILVIGGTYIDSLRADERLIEKFGDDYKSYMKKVSGLNPLVSIIRLLQSPTLKNSS